MTEIFIEPAKEFQLPPNQLFKLMKRYTDYTIPGIAGITL